MEGTKSEVFQSIRSYWRRRTYRRIEGVPLASKKKRVRVVKLMGESGANRRPSKVRPVLRMWVKVFSPIKLMARLRDAYMDAMLALAGGEARPSLTMKGTGSQDGTWERRMPKARQISVKRGDFERRMMLHIYRSLIAPPEVIGI